VGAYQERANGDPSRAMLRQRLQQIDLSGGQVHGRSPEAEESRVKLARRYVR